MVEVKVTSATVASFVASLTIAMLNGVVGDHAILGNLPAFWQWLVIITAPTIITFLSGYLKSSSTSNVSDSYRLKEF